MTKILHIFSLLLLVSFSSISFARPTNIFSPDYIAEALKDFFNDKDMEAFEKCIIESNLEFDEFEKRSDLQINMRNDQVLNEVHIKVNNIHDSKDLQAAYENDILKIITPQELICILFKNNVLTVDVQQQISHNNAIADDNSADDNFTKESISTNVFASHAQQHRTFNGKIDLAQSKVSYKKDAKELIIAIPHQHLSTPSIPITVNIEE